MKTFTGNRADVRDQHGGLIVKIQEGCHETVLSAAASQQLVDHSPNGFNWGYGGSGPAQLALGLLLEVTSDETVALRAYQDFKWEVVAKLSDAWELTEKSILDWVVRREA